MKADPRIEWIEHAGVEAWGEAIAADIQAAIAADLAASGRARALLSGGTTPAPAYSRLAQAPLDWSKVSVGLVDDRFVPADHPASNTKLIRESLLERAPGLHFEPLVREGLSAAACVEAANRDSADAQDPCVAVLGMGNDGHTASLFPGSVDLDAALASQDDYAVLDATGCPVAAEWTTRITLTRAGLARCRQHLLLLRGEAKREVLERALAGDDVRQMPIRAVLGLTASPLRVHWCA